MKTAQQEITEALINNAGSRLTPELIHGLQARLFKIFESYQQTQQENKEVE